MDIKISNILYSLGVLKKVELIQKSSKTESSSKSSSGEQVDASSDSVSISLEGTIKQTALQASSELQQVREEKVKQIKEKIASGTYKVNIEELVKAIIFGKDKEI